jgi:calcineurin-like phosphoesterase family protein
MCFGRGSRKARWWLSKLTGKIVYIKGSHDREIKTTSEGLNCLFVAYNASIKVGNKKFQIVHDPETIKQTNWLVHGHVHNNQPFIDLERKRINVSVDVTNFKPTPLQAILKII